MLLLSSEYPCDGQRMRDYRPDARGIVKRDDLPEVELQRIGNWFLDNCERCRLMCLYRMGLVELGEGGETETRWIPDFSQPCPRRE